MLSNLCGITHKPDVPGLAQTVPRTLLRTTDHQIPLFLRSWPPFTGVPRGPGQKVPHGVFFEWFRAPGSECPKALKKHSVRHFSARDPKHSCKWLPGSQLYAFFVYRAFLLPIKEVRCAILSLFFGPPKLPRIQLVTHTNKGWAFAQLTSRR